MLRKTTSVRDYNRDNEDHRGLTTIMIVRLTMNHGPWYDIGPVNHDDIGPVYHDDHGSNQAKATTEEEEIRTMGKHNWGRID